MKYVRLSLKSIVGSRAEVGARLSAPGDAVLIQRGQPRWLLLKCPCGCGDEIPVNLDRRAGKAWRIYGGGEERITLFPSVWRDTGCRSHFILWRDQIILFAGREEEDVSTSPTHPDLGALASKVQGGWPRGGWVHYLDMADALGEIPWDVLDACRHLARRGFLVEGRGEQRTYFRRS